MKLGGKKIALLVADQYQDLEVWYPYYRMKEEGADIIMVGPEAGKTHSGKFGYPATAERGINEVYPEEFDAVIIPGGFAPDYMRRHPKMVALVRDVFGAGKITASICHGGWMLASAGILKGKKATSFFAIADDLKNAGADWMDEEVVRDGNLITSRKPDDLPAFCRAIIEAMS